MYLLIGAAAALVFFIWLGRRAKSGKLKKGPWFRQGRTIAAVFAVGLGIAAVVAFMRGQWILGSILGSLSASVAGGTRYNWRMGDEATEPQVYTLAEREAFRTLGLEVGADRKTIIAAWKKRMKSAHPDQGGDAQRAARLNAARDVLLKRR
ncbi:MAG: J domain-containing protein [Asticcacaulis sp.]|uniref:J domain-containing protein n=1 Tax=Asticcacaulis tiandongensis TaxID=2565365 RepID=UPI00112A99C9|nr:J domain-containing protein [Asticcacaulis tiandongensis]